MLTRADSAHYPVCSWLCVLYRAHCCWSSCHLPILEKINSLSHSPLSQKYSICTAGGLAKRNGLTACLLSCFDHPSLSRTVWAVPSRLTWPLARRLPAHWACLSTAAWLSDPCVSFFSSIVSCRSCCSLATTSDLFLSVVGLEKQITSISYRICKSKDEFTILWRQYDQ